ncbi:NADH-quinone oxidoreductase subunit H [Actinomadura atramentaria]|uniref:NADH-quinone oxidoreductase subunit H n=1 Tax=Actinomadura atramentaria TaxID=1990 RepID=UPI00036A803B|nr:NADH-quinone oxidoreductase subunit H [Actinomadura atramentaria]
MSGERTPVWAVVALPAAVGLLAYAVAVFDAVAVEGMRGRAFARPLRRAALLAVRQRRTTLAADRLLLGAGVAVLPAAALLAALVVPVGGVPVVASPVGIVWFNAAEVATWAAAWLVGWGPNAAFSLVGGYRFLAQGLAYELPHMFVLITVAVGAGSLDLTAVAAAQRHLWFAVQMPVAFALYLVSASALAFWGPFAHPLDGALGADLSGADRLLFLGGRCAMLAVAGAAAVPLFLGGGAGPLLPAPVWSLVKTLAVLAALVFAGARVPRLRMDRFLAAAWTVLIPVALLQLLVVAVTR